MLMIQMIVMLTSQNGQKLKKVTPVGVYGLGYWTNLDNNELLVYYAQYSNGNYIRGPEDNVAQGVAGIWCWLAYGRGISFIDRTMQNILLIGNLKVN
jgi:hypothetical protein